MEILMKHNKTILALLFGGKSAEHEVSVTSARSIFDNLNRNKYRIHCIYVNKDGRWRAVTSPHLSTSELDKGDSFSFLPWKAEGRDHGLSADVYFPVMHGPYGEDGTIQGLFELADIPYVGAGVLASAAGMDKAVAKTLFRARGLPAGKYRVVYQMDWMHGSQTFLRDIQSELSLPYFVKPANMGSSVGITKVKKAEELENAVHAAFLHDRKILVEEGIQGREIECSVLGNDALTASVPGEIIPHAEFYDYQDKYVTGKTTFQIPAPLAPDVVERIQKLAMEAFRAIEGSGMARVDFFLQDKTERIFINEINTIPGFTAISMYPKLWSVSGLEFSDLLDTLINLAVERHALRSSRKRNSP